MGAAKPDQIAIELSNLSFGWPGGGFGLDIERFCVGAGESLLVLGQSGSGKSTLLSLICGLATPLSGTIHVAGQDLGQMSRAARDRFRADTIGIIFQMFNLLPFATPRDNILLPLDFSPARRQRCPHPQRDAQHLASALGLSEAQISRGTASALSVGQQQRVAVARAMIGAPPIVIADEPTSALDDETAAEFLDLLFAQIRDTGATLVMVSHDTRLSGRFDRVERIDQIARTRDGAPA